MVIILETVMNYHMIIEDKNFIRLNKSIFTKVAKFYLKAIETETRNPSYGYFLINLIFNI